MKKIILFFGLFLGILGLSSKFSTEATTQYSMAGIVNTNGTNLNVRSRNTTSSSIISKVKDQSYLTILNTSGDFYYVEYLENTFGYVHKDYVDIISKNVKKVSTGGANLNVRYGPSTSYTQFEKVKDNDYVIILSNQGSFSRVLFEGNKTGYVSNTYLTDVRVSYPAISLSVPSYKQYDSRWANLTLGNKGQTIKEIGCLTTCIAMSESYRTGTTKTPATIRNTMSYTSTGELYWPSNYTTSTTSSYMTAIYNQLKLGKPVAIGLKKSNGGQHWVLVTGYTGGNSLTSGNFTIHDPASTKTRLSEVIANYPYFYKIAYYK